VLWFYWFGAPSLVRERVRTLQLLLSLASTVILGSKSPRNYDHILLSQMWDSPSRRAIYVYTLSLSLYIYISPEEVGAVLLPGTGLTGCQSQSKSVQRQPFTYWAFDKTRIAQKIPRHSSSFVAYI
jgi:hypothetical protein